MDELLKRAPLFEISSYQVGMFGGGTQPAKYFDKNGVEVPFRKTKWFKLSKKKEAK